MTQDDANKIVRTSTRCTEAVMRAFGINDEWPEHYSGCVRFLCDAGYVLTEVECGDMSVKEFMRVYQCAGESFMLFTYAHVLCVIEDVIVDTAGFKNYARVRLGKAFRVTRSLDAASQAIDRDAFFNTRRERQYRKSY